MTATRPPGLTRSSANLTVAGLPTASIAQSAPLPPESEFAISITSSLDGFKGLHPLALPFSNLPSSRSTAITVAAPRISADSCAKTPTGPQPITTTVSLGPTSARSAPIYPVGRMSVRNNTCSSSSSSGILKRLVSANGTRTPSACPPGLRGEPKILVTGPICVVSRQPL